MHYLNGCLFLLMLITWLFLPGVVKRGQMVPIFYEIAPLPMDSAGRADWIMPDGGMVAEIFGTVARRLRYQKFPFHSFPSVGLDWRNRESKQVKRKPKATL